MADEEDVGMPPEEGSIEEEAAGEELGQEEYAAEDGGAAEWDEGAANDGAGDDGAFGDDGGVPADGGGEEEGAAIEGEEGAEGGAMDEGGGEGGEGGGEGAGGEMEEEGWGEGGEMGGEMDGDMGGMEGDAGMGEEDGMYEDEGAGYGEDDAVSFSESQLSESEADDALGALSRDELLASLLDDTIIEDVAAKIEGFDDDFQEPEDEQEDAQEEDLEAQDLQLDERILEAKRRWDAGMELHRLLESRISQHLQSIRGAHQQTALQEDAPGTLKFHHKLSSWQALRMDKQAMSQRYEQRLADMRGQLEERRRKADEIAKTFRAFVVEVAKGSEDSRTGHPLPARDIRQRLNAIAGKELELQHVRLRAVQLRGRFEKAEANMRSKEQLAEGLHLIDFEQLKIENQSLNEEIEERNEELSKLSRKAMASVLILTHVKEKLQFVEKENLRLVGRLEELEASLAVKRDRLHDLKVHRDGARRRLSRMKEQKTTVSSPMLIEDIQGQRMKRNELKAQLIKVKDQFSELSSEATTLRGRLTTASAAAGGGGMWGGSMAMSQAMSQGRPSRPSRGPMEGG